jgi:pimeloyl-ACP methyl ester carboxylesterase
MLLNHEWVVLNKAGTLATVAQDPKYPSLGKTALFIHGAGGCLLDSRASAFRLVDSSSPSESWQCLLVDLRGHGGSDLDDYAEPHSLDELSNDVLECVVSYGVAPDVVVAAGDSLSYLVALKYAQRTLAEGGAPSSLSYEASGEDAVPSPAAVVFHRYEGLFPPQSVDSFVSRAASTVTQVGAYLKSQSGIGSRAELRKHLLLSRGESSSKSVLGSLLASLKCNFDTLRSDDPALYLRLGLQPECDVELNGIGETGKMLESVGESAGADAGLRGIGGVITKLGPELPGLHLCVVSSSNQQSRLLTHTSLSEQQWHNSLKRVLKALII